MRADGVIPAGPFALVRPLTCGRVWRRDQVRAASRCRAASVIASAMAPRGWTTWSRPLADRRAASSSLAAGDHQHDDGDDERDR